MAFGNPRVVDTQTNITADADSGAIKVLDIGRNLNLLVDVTARIAGTLDITVEWSHDGGTKYAPAESPDAFTQINDTGLVIKQFILKAPTYRIVYVVASTPDFDFSISEFLT